MSTETFADGTEHGTPEGFKLGCRKEKDCPASYTHGMCCLYAHVRSTTDIRYFKAKARDQRPAAIARALGIKPIGYETAAKEAAVDDDFAHRHAGYRYRDRRQTTPATPEHPKEPAMPTPNDVAKTSKPLTVTHVPDVPEVDPAPVDEPAAAGFETFRPITTDRWTQGLSVAKKTAKLREIRDWCRAHGFPGVPSHGRIPQDALAAYDDAHPTELTDTEIEADKNASEARAAIAAAVGAAIAAEMPTQDAAQPLAESANDPDPQEDAGDPAIETEAPTAPSEPAAEDEAMGHPTTDDAVAIEEALAEGADIPTGNDYTDVLDEARERAHQATTAELAEMFGVNPDDVVPHWTSGAVTELEVAVANAAMQMGEQLLDATPRPEWADVAISEDVERAREVLLELQEELNEAHEDVEKARSIAIRLEQELAEAERQRDEAQRSMILALRQWADERAKRNRDRVQLLQLLGRVMRDADAERAGLEQIVRDKYHLANMRKAQASQHRRWIRRGR